MTLLGILWLATDGMVTNYSGPFCFSLGALFAIKKIDFVDFSFKYWKTFVPLFLACMIGYTIIMGNGNYGIGFLIQKFGMFFGLFSFIAIAGLLVKRGAKIPAVLTSSGMLIYVYHGIFSGKVSQIISNAANLNSDTKLIAMHFAVTALLAGIGVLLYAASKKAFPKLSSWICGR